MSTSFVGWAKTQPWYAQIEPQMQSAGVPDYVWLSIVEDESSGNPNANVVDTNGVRSYGLFQLNGNSGGLDPVYAGSWAANKLGPALAGLGPSYTPQQALTAAEQAAWPGNDSTLDAQEFPQRWAIMQSVLQQEGMSAYAQTSNSAVTAPATLASASGQTPTSSNNPLTSTYWQQVAQGWNTVANATANAPATIEAMVPAIETNLFIGAVILAILAGGFALMSAGD